MTEIKKPSGRLLSLDVLRGITIAGMILVNNPGSWLQIYAPLGHAEWHGLTPTDLVFPFFMFIMGISTYISLRKYKFEFSKDALLKILKRTIVIFLIGLAIAWLSLFMRTFNKLSIEDMGFFERLLNAANNFENLRIMGVMQRLSITYGITSIIGITVKHRYILPIAAGLMITYLVILLVGNGFERSEDNIVSILDQAILGVNHMYKDGGLAIDPEGLLSTIPAIAHVLIGFFCGQLIMSTKDNHERIEKLFIIGTILTFAGFLFDYGCPINKKLWTPTFVLTTCGLASLFLALLIWIIDIKGVKKWSVFFESFGVNPLFLYVFGAVLTILFGTLLIIPYDGDMISIHTFLYKIVLVPIFGDLNGSLAYALIFVTINWLVGNILYKKQIYIKI